LLDRCRQKQIHTVVDTSLFANSEIVLEVAQLTNLFLVDLKAFDSETHQRFTGVPNSLILNNIELLASNGYDFIIRIPFIRGVNTDRATLEQEAAFLASLPWTRKEVNLLLYHDIAKGKHLKLGSSFDYDGLSTPTDEEVERAKAIFGAKGITVSVGG
jgi:pyruvate formate lyase activating enzyme